MGFTLPQSKSNKKITRENKGSIGKLWNAETKTVKREVLSKQIHEQNFLLRYSFTELIRSQV